MTVSEPSLRAQLGSLDLAGINSLLNMVHGVEDLTAAPASGNLDIFGASRITLAAADFAATLPNGKYKGQIKRVTVLGTAGTNKFTLTVTTPSGTQPGTWVFDRTYQSVEWRWDGAAWIIHLVQPAGVKTGFVFGTDNVGANNLYACIVGTIDGTKNSTLADGFFIGQVLHLAISAAINTPVGALNTAHFRDRTGVARTAAGAIGATTAFADWEWNGAEWQDRNSTGITYS